MSKRVRENTNFLSLLYKADLKQRKALLGSISKEQLLALCEVILNIIKGVIPISQGAKDKLRRYAKVLRLLAAKGRVSQRKKIDLLVRHHRFVPILLKACKKFLDSLHEEQQL